MVGHQAVCDYCRAVLTIVALDQAKTIFVVAGIEEYQLFSHPPIVDVIIVIPSEHVTSIWHL